MLASGLWPPWWSTNRWDMRSSVMWLGSPPGVVTHTGHTWHIRHIVNHPCVKLIPFTQTFHLNKEIQQQRNKRKQKQRNEPNKQYLYHKIQLSERNWDIVEFFCSKWHTDSVLAAGGAAHLWGTSDSIYWMCRPSLLVLAPLLSGTLSHLTVDPVNCSRYFCTYVKDGTVWHCLLHLVPAISRLWFTCDTTHGAIYICFDWLTDWLIDHTTSSVLSGCSSSMWLSRSMFVRPNWPQYGQVSDWWCTQFSSPPKYTAAKYTATICTHYTDSALAVGSAEHLWQNTPLLYVHIYKPV